MEIIKNEKSALSKQLTASFNEDKAGGHIMDESVAKIQREFSELDQELLDIINKRKGTA